MAYDAKEILSNVRQNLATKFSPLWAHQKETIDFASTRNHVFDTSDPGTGKTRAHLEVFNKRYNEGASPVCLVLAPKSLLRTAWYADARKYTPNLRCSIAYSTNREKAFDEKAHIYITNIDAVKWLAKQTNAWLHQKFPPGSTLIIDESTAVKHRSSARSKAANRISAFFTHITCMTGTPMPHSVTELWHQVYIIDRGLRLGNNFYKFRNAVQFPVARGAFTDWKDKPGIELAVAELIKDITIRHQFDVCMDIPKNFTYFREYEPNAQLLKQYRELKAKSILDLEAGKIKAVNAAVLKNKLLQLLSGAVYDELGEYHVIDDFRYELVADLIEEVNHSVCFFNWRHQKDLIASTLDKRGISFAILDGSVSIAERESIVYHYQKGKYQTILLHPQTGAHGLTLTKGTRTIWSSPIYQPDFLIQGRHRIHRGGQTMVTDTVLVAATGTIEEAVYEVTNDKEKKMVTFLDILRDAL